MSYVYYPSGGGPTTVTTDGTSIDGDGTALDPIALLAVAVDGVTITGDGAGTPLSATPTPASLTDNVSAYVTVDIGGLTAPITKALNTVTEMTADPAFTGTSVIFNGVGTNGLQFTVAGTYQVTFQVSWETIPAPSKTDFNVDLTILDAPGFGTVVARGLSHQHLETGDIATGSVSITKTFVIGVPNTIFYLQGDFTSAVPIDFSVKGNATNYSYVEVVRLA